FGCADGSGYSGRRVRPSRARAGILTSGIYLPGHLTVLKADLCFFRVRETRTNETTLARQGELGASRGPCRASLFSTWTSAIPAPRFGRTVCHEATGQCAGVVRPRTPATGAIHAYNPDGFLH